MVLLCHHYVWTGSHWYLRIWCTRPWIFMDFHEIIQTCSNSSSAMRRSLRTLRYTRTMYWSRSRDLAARKPGRIAARDRKSPANVRTFFIFQILPDPAMCPSLSLGSVFLLSLLPIIENAAKYNSFLRHSKIQHSGRKSLS